MKIICVDMGPACPVGASPIKRRVAVRDMVVHHYEADEELRDIEDKLQHLTVGILDISTDDLLRCYQRQTVGLSR